MSIRSILKRIAPSLGIALLLLSPARAQSIDRIELVWVEPSGRTVASEFLTLAEIVKLPATSLRQRTPWTQAESTFVGPLLRDIAARAGKKVATATFYALNDYYFSMPAEDWARHDVILAAMQDGRPMPVEDKGPYWVLYPLAQYPQFANQPFRSRMVWQISRIVFELLPN